VTRVDGDVVALRHDVDDSIEVGEVDFGMDALSIEVQSQVHQVDVASTFPVAEQTAFNTVGTGELRELGSRNSGPWEEVSAMNARKHRFQLPLSL
jgi:hypothetical protein